MGSTVCQAVQDDPDLEPVTAVDPSYRGIDLRTVTGVDNDLKISGEAGAFERTGAQVVVDFSQRSASVSNLEWLAEHGVHAVVGTTGFSDEELETFRSAFTRSNCVLAPNFAIGAVLMMHFAELAAPYFDSAEIIELHHDAKIDAPSGTAMLTVQRMAAASQDWTDDPTEDELIEGARGGDGPDRAGRLNRFRALTRRFHRTRSVTAGPHCRPIPPEERSGRCRRNRRRRGAPRGRPGSARPGLLPFRRVA